MKHFTSVHDIGDLKIALEKAKQVKENRLPTNIWAKTKL